MNDKQRYTITQTIGGIEILKDSLSKQFDIVKVNNPGSIEALTLYREMSCLRIAIDYLYRARNAKRDAGL